MIKKFREGLSFTADVLQVVAAVAAAIGGGVVLALLAGDVPAWSLALALGVALVLLALLIRSRRRPSRSPERELEKSLELVAGYLSQVEDILGELQQVITGSAPAAQKRDDLARLRELTFTAIFRGVHSEKGEQVRCVYLEPITEGAETMLAAKHHQGHSSKVSLMRLHSDRRSVAGCALMDREPVYVPDAPRDPRVQATPGGKPIGTILCLPIERGKGEAQPRGVLSVSSSRLDAFSVSDQEFISVCAIVVALIEHADVPYGGGNGGEPPAGTPTT